MEASNSSTPQPQEGVMRGVLQCNSSLGKGWGGSTSQTINLAYANEKGFTSPAVARAYERAQVAAERRRIQRYPAFRPRVAIEHPEAKHYRDTPTHEYELAQQRRRNKESFGMSFIERNKLFVKELQARQKTQKAQPQEKAKVRTKRPIYHPLYMDDKPERPKSAGAKIDDNFLDGFEEFLSSINADADDALLGALEEAKKQLDAKLEELHSERPINLGDTPFEDIQLDGKPAEEEEEGEDHQELFDEILENVPDDEKINHYIPG